MIGTSSTLRKHHSTMIPHSFNLVSKFPSILLCLLLFLSINVVAAESESTNNKKCFADRAELKYAIDVCFEGGYGDRACHTDTFTDADQCEQAKEIYGWPMNLWCVREVTDMHFLFVEKSDFNEDISDWDTSNVDDFYEMFSYASSFDCDLSKWDTSKVKKAYGMFNGCDVFNGDVSTWDTSSLEDMQWMFYGAKLFNQDLSKWDVSKVTNMWEVFVEASAFTSDLSKWDTSSVIYMQGMFYDAPAFNSDLSNWDTGNVWSMKWMFYNAKSFNSDLSKWDLSSLTTAEFMFQGASAFNQNLCAWKDTFLYREAEDIFLDSGCTFEDDPDRDDQGPFCASDCITPTVSPSKTPTVSTSMPVATLSPSADDLPSSEETGEDELTNKEEEPVGQVADETETTQPAATTVAPDVEIDDDTCSVCPGGLTVEKGAIIPYPEAGGASCEQMIGYAANVDASSGQCSEMKEAEAFCCPSDETETTTTNDEDDVCIICPDGFTVDEDLDIGQGATCGSLAANALKNDASSQNCENMKGAETICCPTPAVNPCPICYESGGITVAESTFISEGRTCGGLVADASNTEADDDVCELMKGAEGICCPAQAEEPCLVCPDGITVDESTVISESKGMTLTCGGLVADALNTEESSEVCSQMMGGEAVCCPAQAEEPCPVCPSGITVDESTVISESKGMTLTCGGLVVDALNMVESSEICSQMMGGEAVCCPPLDELLTTTTEMPTRTPTTEVPTPGTTTSAPVSSAPTASPEMTTTSVPTTTANIIASPVPTSGATSTITPTNTVTRASQAPTKNTVVDERITLIPTKKTAEEDSTTLTPSTHAPTTEDRPMANPAGATTENLPISRPVFEEPALRRSGSTCLRVVSSGCVGLVLTSIASIVYAMIDL